MKCSSHDDLYSLKMKIIFNKYKSSCAQIDLNAYPIYFFSIYEVNLSKQFYFCLLKVLQAVLDDLHTRHWLTRRWI